MKKQNMYITTLLLGIGMSALSACGVDSNISIQPLPDDLEQINTNIASGQVQLFTTTADGVQQLQSSEKVLKTGTNMVPSTILLDASKRFQTMDGFGFALTYSSCYNLLKMKEEARMALLKRIYSRTEGYGVSYARISIGCNDFSSTEYSLCDTPGLDNFRLYKDETDYVIPILKEVLSINPDLKIIAAPWTCPKWMKVNNLTDLQPYDSWTDGHLNPSLREDYANYFVKFVKTMRDNGINIFAVSPQNEPLNKKNCASLYMPWDEEAAFVKQLAGAFKRNGIQTKIYVFDHNYNYDGLPDQEDYPIKLYNALGSNYEGAELVAGAAYHDYGGTNDELTDIFQQAPDKELIFSESSIGTWNDGRNLAKRLLADMENIALGTVNKMCKGVLVWNLMLDSQMGPNLDGGCQTCFGAIDIDKETYSTLSYNSHFYAITHLSSVVQPGAVRIGTSRNVQNKDIINAVFLNPDGTYGAILLNKGDYDQSITLSDGNNYFACQVPAQGIVSCRWK